MGKSTGLSWNTGTVVLGVGSISGKKNLPDLNLQPV